MNKLLAIVGLVLAVPVLIACFEQAIAARGQITNARFQTLRLEPIQGDPWTVLRLKRDEWER